MSTELARALEATHLATGIIEGWVGSDIWRFVSFIGETHEQYKVQGDILEIGVHHGKLFLLLATLLRDTETATAVDVFEDQALNIGNSGHGSRKMLEIHIDRIFPDHKPKFRIIKADSMSFTPRKLSEIVTKNGFRLISVDGGHEVEHVINDLNFAQDHLNPMGFVMLDDYFNKHWPSVSEGFFRYMDRYNRRLKPFLAFQNKLFLTTYSEHPGVLWACRQFLDRQFGARVHSEWKMVTIAGAQAWSHAA